MEVNDRPTQSGGDDENTTKASKANDNAFMMVIYRKLVHFLMNELKLWGKHLLIAYVYFLTSMKSALKLLDITVIS